MLPGISVSSSIETLRIGLSLNVWFLYRFSSSPLSDLNMIICLSFKSTKCSLIAVLDFSKFLGSM